MEYSFNGRQAAISFYYYILIILPNYIQSFTLKEPTGKN